MNKIIVMQSKSIKFYKIRFFVVDHSFIGLKIFDTHTKNNLYYFIILLTHLFPFI